jgi:hypothetical protein
MRLGGIVGRRLSRDEQALLERHRRRAGSSVAEFRGNSYPIERLEHVERRADALNGDRERALSALIVAIADTEGGWLANELASKLVRQKLPYSLDDARLLVRLLELHRGPSWFARTCARSAVAALEARVAAGDDVDELAERLLRQVVKPRDAEASEWTKLGLRVRRLAPPKRGELDLSPLRADDPWSARVRPLVSREFRDCGPLLAHLATATQSRPSARWLAAVEPLLAGGGEAMLKGLLETAVDVQSRETGREFYDGEVYVSYLWLSDPSATLVRGALWAASLLANADWVAPTCERLVERARKEEQLKVGNAAFHCLGARADDVAVAVLGRMVAQLQDRRFLKPAQRALEAAAERRGITSEQLREQLVPHFALAGDGRRERPVGPAVAVVELVPPAQVRTRFRLDGKETASAPEVLRDRHAGELSACKSEIAEIRKELSAQRTRLENLLAADRVWTPEDWRAYYLEHPLVQLFARRLIWRFGEQAAIPVAQDEYFGLHGVVRPDPEAPVRLWHPLDSDPAEIAAWRTLVRERELRQPFKQAYREIYLLAPAERETGLYSNRFAAHIVRYPQVYALAKQRGWGVRALGWYDNDGGEQWRDFPEQGLRASFWMELADGAPGGGLIADLASTDQVRFTRAGGHDPVPLEEIPPIVFSEAMRDVDLFVGVASIAADPTWLDGGVDRFNAYWHEHAFGELSESAALRRELLAELLPGMKIADRLEIDGRYLRVRGRLHTYRIHLGSANILIEPHDRYLCIVPDRRPSTGRLFLPFEDDRLSVILSKALLLADDDRITDPTIVQQLR